MAGNLTGTAQYGGAKGNALHGKELKKVRARICGLNVYVQYVEGC